MAKCWDPFSWVLLHHKRIERILPKSEHQHHLTHLKFRRSLGFGPLRSQAVQGTVEVLSPSTGWFA